MTIKEFLEEFNHAPYELYEVAELLSGVSDNDDAARAAKIYLGAKENLEMTLDDIGFEFG